VEVGDAIFHGGWESGARKSKVCAELRTGGGMGADWRKLPWQLRGGQPKKETSGDGNARRVNFWNGSGMKMWR
jgi:hypothetical protein